MGKVKLQGTTDMDRTVFWRRRLAVTFLAGAMALPPTVVPVLGQGVNILSTSANQEVKLGLDKSIVIDLPEDATDILVANPEVADAVTRTSRRIYFFGKKVGRTNVFVFGEGERQIASFDLVIERDVKGLVQYLRRFLPDADISAEIVNDNVVLTGTVRSPLDASKAEELATIYVSGGQATGGPDNLHRRQWRDQRADVVDRQSSATRRPGPGSAAGDRGGSHPPRPQGPRRVDVGRQRGRQHRSSSSGAAAAPAPSA